MDQHPIMLDNREDASGFIAYVQSQYSDQAIWKLILTNLFIGDAQISEEGVFEIKRITKKWNPTSKRNAHDLLSSLWDGRFWNQTEDRFLNFKRSILIIQIDPGAKFFNQYFSEAMWIEMKNDAMWYYNQHIEYSTSHEETWQIILNFFLISINQKDHHDPTNKSKKETALIDQQRYFLSGLIGIGKKQSLILLQLFKTPLCILKWILETQLTYTKNNKLKGTNSNVPDFGPTFFEKNQKLLTTQAKEII